MTDRKQVIFDLERCTCHVPDACRDCSKYEMQVFSMSCMENLMMDALELLKEQEAGVSPKEIKMYPGNVWACGNCGHVAVGSAAYKAKYCPECGKKVQWGG